MFFDEKAVNWDIDPSKAERAQSLARKISEFGKGKGLKKAMEYGCGTGLLSFFLNNEFVEITLADTSPGMIQVLKDKMNREGISNFHPVLLQTDEKLPGQEFDVIYSLMVLHHVKDLDAAFSDFHRVLKSGRYLFIADLVREEGDFHAGFGSNHEHNGFDKEQLVGHLERSGFHFLDYQIYYSIEKTTESGIKKQYPLFVLIAQKE